MKSKLLIFIIIVTVMLTLFAIPVLASSNVIEISRPEGDEIVTKQMFSICGTSIEDGVIIEILYRDIETDEYKPLLTTDGKSSFSVGKIFGKDIKLKYKGENEIQVKAYAKSTKNDPQIETYIITVAEEKKDGNWLENALDWFQGTDANEKK
ncbi:MAG: hypothetical protein ACYDG2_09190 [Ruminiclostridium sp.]